MNKQLYWSWTNKETTLEDVLAHVPDGWHEILRNLIDDLFIIGWNGRLIQTKEKFGGLRFYIEAGNDAMYAIIRNAEKASYQTCEVCGKPGERRDGMWIRTLCDEHAGIRRGDNNIQQGASV